MKQPRYSPTRGESLEPTEARQGGPQKMGLRVLLISTAIVAIVLIGFWVVFLQTTTPEMSTSGTNVNGQQVGTPAAPNALPNAPEAENPGEAVKKPLPEREK